MVLADCAASVVAANSDSAALGLQQRTLLLNVTG
jgi:hypothetical protein